MIKGARSPVPLGWPLGFAIILLATAALFVGETNLFDPNLDRSSAWTILAEVRLPRVLLAIIIGAGLGMTGAALQGLTANPLAEPGLIGASAMAALTVVLLFYFGLALTPIFLPIGGLVGAALALILMLRIIGPEANGTVFILAGVALNALAGALTALALNLAPSPYALSEILFWLMGSFEARRLTDLALATPFIIGGCLLLLTTRPGLAALTLGEETAQSLGLSLPSLRRRVLFGAAAVTGAATAVAGAIGFVGLLAPHFLRPFVGARPDRLLWPSAAVGAALLLAADILVRILPGQSELRLGVVTALIGAPFFIYLLRTVRRGAVDA